jgi:hypothetical protein
MSAHSTANDQFRHSKVSFFRIRSNTKTEASSVPACAPEQLQLRPLCTGIRICLLFSILLWGILITAGWWILR